MNLFHVIASLNIIKHLLLLKIEIITERENDDN
jgi:hypothetical protein